MNPNGSIAIIPARFQSSRLPGKPLKVIAGRTLIEHVYRRVEQVRGLDRILVATDDGRIAEAVRGFGGEAVMTRADHATGTDRLAEAAAGLPGSTIVVNVQGDEPMIEPGVVEAALGAALVGDADVVTLKTRLEDPAAIQDPNNVKVVTDEAGMALYFSRSPVPSSGTAFLHLGLYAYSAGFLRTFAALEPTGLERAERLEQLRVLGHGFRMRVVEVESRSWGIDTEADLRAFERVASPETVGRPGADD
jgi:3-deoxy-manno-octulosonate cytidylyltransferase (CMP-KDO synthetase)